MASPFQIRAFEAADFATICELDALCFPSGIAYPPEEIAWFLAQRGAICLVAIVDERVVAWILGLARRGATGHVITIDVHPDSRRLGIGNDLMDAMEDQFRMAPCKVSRLEVATDNAGAQAFYKRRGYTEIRRLHRYYSDGSDAFLMERRL